MKTCNKCKCQKEFDAFSRQAEKADGRKSVCKECCRAQNAEYMSRQTVVERLKQYRRSQERMAGNAAVYRERVENGKNREYYRRAEVKARRKAMAGTAEFREKRNARHRSADYRMAQRIVIARRRARLAGLPCKFTYNHVRAGLMFWLYRCPACDVSFSCADIHWDHWIPVSSQGCPGTIAGNMVPLCKSCNLTKNARDPKEWLVETHGQDLGGKLFEMITLFLQLADLRQERLCHA